MADIVLNILHFLLTLLFLGLSILLLLAGRSYIWVLLGGAGFLVAATIAAELQGYSHAWSLVEQQLWLTLSIALGVGAVGAYVGWNYRHLAADIVGFAAGIFIASWFDEILLVLNGDAADAFTWWTALLTIAAGFLGVWLTRRDTEQALILLSVVIGAKSIADVLNLDQSASSTAVITLGLTLTGIVVQYASYLRERPRIGQRLPPVPHPVSDELPYE